MVDLESIHRRADEYHKGNTKRVLELLQRDFDLRDLESVFNPVVAGVYRTVLPRYATLCETNQSRSLDDAERALFAVSYASLHASFGDEGTVFLAAAWLATKPYRQARGS
ncbi:MAG: hypothetical protein NTY06_00565 [Candidatus Gottesmanbacteria bacterium]|nr:hypothetical protein [Candidatus Gottesmanbacteria bacterium]